MTIYRPDWAHVYDRAEPRAGDQDLILVTRETLLIARSAIQDSQSRDAYHNYSEAWREIDSVLTAGSAGGMQMSATGSAVPGVSTHPKDTISGGPIGPVRNKPVMHSTEAAHD